MKSFISRKKGKLLAFLVVALLALPLAYTGCHGKGQIETGTETEDLTLEAEPVVSIDDQLAELRAELEAEIQKLKDEGVAADQDALAKKIAQKEELDKLLAELEAANKALDEKEEEVDNYDKEQAEAAEKAAEAAGGAIERFKLSFMPVKGSSLRMTGNMPVDEETGEQVESEGGEFIPLKVGFCSTLDKDDCKIFKTKDVAVGDTIVITGDNLEDFPGDLTMADTRLIRLYNISNRKIHVGPVQIIIGTKVGDKIDEELFYLSPLYNAIVKPETNIAFNQEDDWTGILTVVTKDSGWSDSKSRRCHMRKGHMHVYLDDISISNDLHNNLTTRIVDNEDMSDIRGLDNTASNTFSWKLMGPGPGSGGVWQSEHNVGLFAFTAPLGKDYIPEEYSSGKSERPVFRLRASGKMDFNSMWCADKYKLTLIRVSDILKPDFQCYFYERTKDRKFLRGSEGNRTDGPNTTEFGDCAFVENMRGDGAYQEGPLAPKEWYEYSKTIAVSEDGEDVEVEETEEEELPAALKDARDELEKGIDAAAEIPNYETSIVAANTLIGIAKAKLGAIAAAYTEATEVDQKTCLKTEMNNLEDAIHEIQLDAVRAGISLAKAWTTYLDGKLQLEKAGSDQTAIANAVSTLATVKSYVTVIVAEKDAALATFNGVTGVCTEGETLLVLPTSEDEEVDTDSDGIVDDFDNCPNTANADQADADADNVGDACDNCPDVANEDQADADSDGTGDACQQ